MKQAIYFELNKHLKSKNLCLILTRVLYIIYMLIFSYKKMFLRRKKHNYLSEEAALEILNKRLPYKESKPKCNNLAYDKNVCCSVIVPVYNHEDILEETLDSIVDQKCKYLYEVILVDDGSNEKTKAILKKYEINKSCKVIYQKNQGIAGARNTGLNNAVGEYIMFMDCDDIVNERIVEKLLDVAYRDNSDIAIGSYRLVKENNGVVTSVKNYIFPLKLMDKNTSENEIMNYPGYPWGKIYKRKLFENVRFFTGYWYEDTIIQFLIYRECSKYSYVPEVLYDYKWYEKNFSKVQNSVANVNGIQRYWMLLIMIEKSKELNLPEDETFYITLLRHLGIYYYGNMKDFDEELKQAMFISASYLLKKYKKQSSYKLPYALKNIEQALISQDYELWELACQFQ